MNKALSIGKKTLSICNMLMFAFVSFLQTKLRYRIRPKVIQLPITGKCNSRCVTCNVWKNKSPINISQNELKKILLQPYFKNVKAVGINGGEPTLHEHYEEVINAILELPRLKKIYLISNGLLSSKLFPVLEYGKKQATIKGVSFNCTISVDGINQTHNTVRGIPVAFEKTMANLYEIMNNKDKYCDNLDIGCTISKYNVYHLAEYDSYVSELNIPVYYHLAVPNKRIGTFDDSSYSVLTDKRAKLLTEEFFLTKFLSEKNWYNKKRYFMNFYYLKNAGKKRLAICHYLYRDVTIDENLNLYLCATASDCIGNLQNSDVNSFIKNEQIRKIEKQTSAYCNTCIHYTEQLSLKGLFALFTYVITKRIKWNVIFR